MQTFKMNRWNYFVFYDDRFEFHYYGRTTLVFARNIRFFSFSEGVLSVYFVRDGLENVRSFLQNEKPVPENSQERSVALKGDGELFRLTVPRIGWYKGHAEILRWFATYRPQILDGQALQDAFEIEEKFGEKNLKYTAKILEKAGKIASALNWAGVGIGILVAFSPYFYGSLVLIAVAFPIVIAMILHFSNGWIRFDKRGNSIYPTVCLSIIASSMGLAWRMLNVYSVLDMRRFMLTSLATLVLHLVIFMLCQKDFSFSEGYTYVALLFYLPFFFMYALAATCALNCIFDFSTAVEQTTNGTTILVHRGFFCVPWCYARADF